MYYYAIQEKHYMSKRFARRFWYSIVFRKYIRELAPLLGFTQCYLFLLKAEVAETTSWNTGKTESIRFRTKEARCFASSFRAFLFCFFVRFAGKEPSQKRRTASKVYTVEWGVYFILSSKLGFFWLLSVDFRVSRFSSSPVKSDTLVNSHQWSLQDGSWCWWLSFYTHSLP